MKKEQEREIKVRKEGRNKQKKKEKKRREEGMEREGKLMKLKELIGVKIEERK